MIPRFLRRFDWVVTICCMSLLGYIAWHMQQGARGYEYRDTLLAEKESLDSKLASLLARNSAFEAHVKLLRPESIDPDLVDEIARRDLSMARPHDLIVHFAQ